MLAHADKVKSHLQVMEQNPKLAKQSRVLKVSMDAIYDFAITKEKDKRAAGVTFRFMPDAKEVQSALEVEACTPYLLPHSKHCRAHLVLVMLDQKRYLLMYG